MSSLLPAPDARTHSVLARRFALLLAGLWGLLLLPELVLRTELSGPNLDFLPLGVSSYMLALRRALWGALLVFTAPLVAGYVLSPPRERVSGLPFIALLFVALGAVGIVYTELKQPVGFGFAGSYSVLAWFAFVGGALVTVLDIGLAYARSRRPTLAQLWLAATLFVAVIVVFRFAWHLATRPLEFGIPIPFAFESMSSDALAAYGLGALGAVAAVAAVVEGKTWFARAAAIPAFLGTGAALWLHRTLAGSSDIHLHDTYVALAGSYAITAAVLHGLVAVLAIRRRESYLGAGAAIVALAALIATLILFFEQGAKGMPISYHVYPAEFAGVKSASLTAIVWIVALAVSAFAVWRAPRLEPARPESTTEPRR